MQLRYYQHDAYTAAIASMKANRYPVLQLATGTGKSLIIAAVAEHFRKAGKRVWVLTHVQELVKQNSATYTAYTQLEAGIICSGLNRADHEAQIIFATVQSIINPAVRGDLYEPDLIIVDEAHRIPHNTGESGMYGRLLERFPQAQRLAMTATPWRMDNGLIYGEGDQFWFNHRAYAYTVPQAVRDGYLCSLIGVETEVQLDVDNVSISGDYVMREVGELETAAWLNAVGKSLATLALKRNHIAVYCPTVEAAIRAAAAIAKNTGWEAKILTGAMKPDDRAEVLRDFKSGKLRVLCSVDTITTGFDFPALDCIVCLRPTLSSSLWVQIQGRGTRLHESKKNCLLLDFVGNLQRLGGVDMLDTYVREVQGEASEPIKAEPKEKKKRKQLPGLKTLKPIDPMTGEQAKNGAELEVEVHQISAIPIFTKRNPRYPVLLINYLCTTEENARIEASMFINTEAPSPETYRFFRDRSLAVNLPSPAKSLLWQTKGARLPKQVTVRKSGKYWNVVNEEF